MQVKREKAIYHTLNKLSVDTSRKVNLLVDTELLVHSAGLQSGAEGGAGVGFMRCVLLHD